jgi:hypothetical protein
MESFYENYDGTMDILTKLSLFVLIIGLMLTFVFILVGYIGSSLIGVFCITIYKYFETFIKQFFNLES